MFVVAERFLSNIVNEYGEHPISTDDGVHGIQKHVNS
jgi:hypothetical protein